MEVKKLSKLEVYQKAFEIMKIGNNAVKKAQEENRQLGIANTYSKNGKVYYELPNGEMTTINPY